MPITQYKFVNQRSSYMVHHDFDLKLLDTFMLTTLAPHSPLFRCKEGVLRVNIKVYMRNTTFFS